MSIELSAAEQNASIATDADSSVVQHVAALAFGAIILFAVGFMPMSQAHNAAHDTRHSFAFPCH
jgi:cobalt transporter subunit CbtB